jgi:hypothetical protein
MGDAEEVDKRQSSGGGFVESVKEIAGSRNDEDVIVLVTHREGVWQLQEHVGMQVGAGYCHTSYYNYELSSNNLSSWDPASNPLRVGWYSDLKSTLEVCSDSLMKLGFVSIFGGGGAHVLGGGVIEQMYSLVWLGGKVA